MDERAEIGRSLEQFLAEQATIGAFLIILTLSHGDEVSVKMGRYESFVPGGEGSIVILRQNGRLATTAVAGDKIVAVHVTSLERIENFVADAINHEGKHDFMMMRMHGWKHPRNAKACWMFRPVEEA